MPTTLSTVKLPLHTACLAFCPESQNDWLAVGSYELSECRTIRQGRLHILEVAESHAESLLVVEIFSHELPGEAMNAFSVRDQIRRGNRLLFVLALNILSSPRRL